MFQVKIKEDENNTIGRNIRRIRKSRHMGQTALVRELQLLDIEITREALVKIERGIRTYNFPSCVAFVMFYLLPMKNYWTHSIIIGHAFY